MGMKVAELFAGVGGFRLGLEGHEDHEGFDGSGHEVVWFNQWEPKIKAQHAWNCYAKNFGHDDLEEGDYPTNTDISDVDTADIPDHDLLTAGFPCQDYSVATPKAKGLKGKKGVLWWEIERITREKRPPYLLLENVNRLLRSPTDQRGRDFGVLLKSLDRLGYSVEWRMLKASDYGFPQKRRRVFVFAAHEDTGWGKFIANEARSAGYLEGSGFFPRGFPVKEQQAKLLDEVEPDDSLPEGDDPEALEETSKSYEFHFQHAGVMTDGGIWTTKPSPRAVAPTMLGDVLESDVRTNYADHERFLVPDDDIPDWKYAKGAKEEEREGADGFEYTYKEGSMTFPDALDRPARTILTSEGRNGPSRSRHIIRDPELDQLRILTPVEAERIMGFPDGWTDTGMPEHWRYFVMGNALVVGLVGRMGELLNQVPDPSRVEVTQAPTVSTS